MPLPPLPVVSIAETMSFSQTFITFGVVASGPVRAVCELAGIRDIRTKRLGTNNPRNVVNATMEGLKQLKRVEDVARLRGKTVEEILG